MSKVRQLFSVIVLAYTTVMAVQVSAGMADVIDVDVRFNGDNNFQIITTLAHADTGWQHYANEWQILDESGKVIGRRVLHHPHVNEQPFSRSHTLDIPISVNIITIRGIDSVHGIGGGELSIKLVREK
ncbi:MAG: hypothetical protein ACI8VY_000228 [Cellvibrionaceae bacterium]